MVFIPVQCPAVHAFGNFTHCLCWSVAIINDDYPPVSLSQTMKFFISQDGKLFVEISFIFLQYFTLPFFIFSQPDVVRNLTENLSTWKLTCVIRRQYMLISGSSALHQIWLLFGNEWDTMRTCFRRINIAAVTSSLQLVIKSRVDISFRVIVNEKG